ncbi:site-2 protease family protein [Pantanalinema sp. GBBB05]|uniref:site-2 protease family protein n=1 Tax=Pantanalinema sp. GBBB05 TaxID=2604139 RepID=UPI001DCEE0DB|nr:site-2 protease family protein [Pantanalinema sp. GBBB05]
MITALTVLLALGFLVWGFFRAKPFGKLGILAWLQSVVLMSPWLLFFTLFAAGIYLNLIGVLLLFLLSTGLYIYLGNRLRAMGQDVLLSRRATAIAEASKNTTQPTTATDPESAQPPSIMTTTGQEPDVVPLPAEDLKAIQGIFGLDTFFATETIPYQEGAIFRGNLRGEPEAAYSRLSSSLQERLGDRYRLYLVENQDGKPVVIILPSTRDPKPMTLFQKGFAVVLFLVTIASCMESASVMLGFDLLEAPDRFMATVPIALGLLGVLLAHELGHWIMARRYQVRLSYPFFIPSIPIGSYGALTRFDSLLPNRNVLFDIAFAGPAVGGLISLVMLITGLLLSHEGSLFQVPSEFFQGSILVGTLTRVVLRESLQQPIVDVHPLVVLGWLGLVINALNLMPAGQLDGGRIVQSIYGRKIAGRTTIGTLVVLGLASFVNPLALYWAILVLFLQRDLERPSLNELTEPDDARAALGLLALFLMIVTLLPLTPALAGRLGIGAY